MSINDYDLLYINLDDDEFTPSVGGEDDEEGFTSYEKCFCGGDHYNSDHF